MNRLLFLLAMLCTLGAKCQTDLDAFRYSQYSLTGTADSRRWWRVHRCRRRLQQPVHRTRGMAIYRRSELTFLPRSTRVKHLPPSWATLPTTVVTTSTSPRRLRLTQPLTKNDEGEGWKSWNFGIGLNRINNFHSRSFYEGFNLDNSFTDYLAQQAQGVGYENLDGYYEYLGYYTYLINPDSLNNYTSAVPFGRNTAPSSESVAPSRKQRFRSVATTATSSSSAPRSVSIRSGTPRNPPTKNWMSRTSSTASNSSNSIKALPPAV